jgi:hypothetical protein
MSRNEHSNLTVKPMSDSELYKAAPSIFAKFAIGVTDRYVFVPTSSVLDTFRSLGYYPILASESKVRLAENNGFQKNMVQFRSLENILRPNAKEEYADIIVTNSSDGKASFKLTLSYWRLVCKNMLCIPSHTFSHHSIIHSGFNLEKIYKAIEEITSYMPKIEKQIEAFKTIELNPIEQKSLANAAIDIRFNRELYEVKPEEFLKANRLEDENDNSLWITFQKTQEAMIRGGIKGINKISKKSFTAKAINSIDTNIKMNQELFSTVQRLAELKSPQLMAA